MLSNKLHKYDIVGIKCMFLNIFKAKQQRLTYIFIKNNIMKLLIYFLYKWKGRSEN